MLDAAGESIRAIYLAGSFLPEQLRGREEALGKLDFLVVQELFETDTTAFADVVLPAASFAEIDGTFTNNDGFVQRVRQSIPPVNQAKSDWMITAQLAAELGMDFGFEMSASAVFQRNCRARSGVCRTALSGAEGRIESGAGEVQRLRNSATFRRN